MITTTTKLDLKLDFSSSLLAVVHSSQANERSGDMSNVYDHFIFQEHIWNLQYILCNLMGSQIKGQATDDHNGTNVNGRSLLFFRFGIVVQNSFSGFRHKIYEHHIRDDMFLQLSIHFPYILLDNHAY